jgi:H+/Na+-translocating ferredoxin:NAD+ oxidoreductase subunit D
METRSFKVSFSPHVHDGSSTKKIMWNVILALVPAVAVSIYAFGLNSIRVILLTIISSVLFEVVALLMMNKKLKDSMDGSAFLTGLLLGLTLPPGISNGIIIIGSFVAIIVAKQVFGGVGHNPFNPALTSRVFLLIAFPKPMTTWAMPKGIENITSFMGLKTAKVADAITGATPLAAIKEHAVKTMPHVDVNNLFTGLNTPGSIGEISALALLIGAGYLFYKKIITWEIPVSICLTVFLFALITNVANPVKYANPFFHLFAGGLIIGAFFMATDYVTAPMYTKGKLIYGVGIGLITMLIRLWGGYPEGISFAILLMNSITPLMDRWTGPKPFGYRKEEKKA